MKNSGLESGRTLVLVLLAVPTIATAVSAQALDPPERVTPPPRAQGTTSSLQLGTSLFGGYDHSEVPANPQQATNLTSAPDRLASWGSATLRYSLDSEKRSLNFRGGAIARTNNNQTNPGPVFGANASLGFQTEVGGTSLGLSSSASRTPYYTQGLFGGLPPGAYSPDTNPVNAIVDGYLWSLNSGASVSRPISRRTSAAVTYSYLKSRHEGGISSPWSNEGHTASLGMSHQISRSTDVRGSYRVRNHQTTQAGQPYDGLTHGLTLGFSISQPLGPTRTLAFTAGGGADLIDTGGVQRYWQPTYYASFGTEIARSWVVSTSYTQMSVPLYSPLSAPDSYLTRLLTTSVGGDLRRNLELVLYAGGSQGDVAASQSVTGSSGSYLGLNFGAQVSAAVSNGWAFVVSTNYYRSELEGAAKQFQVSSGIFQRASMRAGFTWNLPLLGEGRAGRPRE